MGKFKTDPTLAPRHRAIQMLEHAEDSGAWYTVAAVIGWPIMALVDALTLAAEPTVVTAEEQQPPPQIVYARRNPSGLLGGQRYESFDAARGGLTDGYGRDFVVWALQRLADGSEIEFGEVQGETQP